MNLDPVKMLNHVQSAVYFALSWSGVQYGIAKAGLDTATVMVESAVAPSVSGIAGGMITNFALRALNAALSIGIQNSFTTAGDATPPAVGGKTINSSVYGTSPDRSSVTGM